jgi:thiamine biosynthesis lipoprotein
MQTIEFKAMGCHMLAALDNPSARAGAKLAEVPGWFEGWEQCLSRFRQDSELSTINQKAGKPSQVSQVFFKVFQAALEAEHWSGGLVTPAIYNDLIYAGYVRPFDDIDKNQHAHQPAEIETGVNTKSVILDSQTRTILLPPGMRLDFGGIAKGWAAQQAMQRLQMYGSVLIDAGGDIAISSLQMDGQPWSIGVADPFQPDSDLEILKVGRSGVATSGIDFRRWQKDGIWKHHIIDPRTGLPAETDVISATAIAPNVVMAETAAKVSLITGSKVGLDYLNENTNLAGLLVLKDGRRLYSERLAQFLWR